LAVFHGEIFSETTVYIDGNIYEQCSFVNCEIVYSGGDLPRISHCHFQKGSRITLGGCAERTLRLLQAMADPDSGMQHLVRNTFSGLLKS
jgi:hypothetical protein